MIAIFVAGILGFLLGIVVLSFTRVNMTAVGVVRAGSFLFVLLALGAVNFEFGLLPQKGASEFAFEVHENSSYLSEIPNFVLQALINYPAFVLTNNWAAAIGTNAAIAALIFLVAASHGGKAHHFLLAPAVVNFSMFALRDPVIGILFYMFTAVLLRPHSPQRSRALFFLVIGFYYTRPENLVIMGVALALVQYRRSSGTLVRVLTIPGLAAALYAALRFGPRLLGVRVAYSVTEAPRVLEEFFERRSNRFGLEEGNTSAILGGRLPSFPLPIRFPIQLFTFVVLPLPFEIRSLSMLMAFVDSAFLMFIVWKYRKHIHPDAILLAVVFVLFSAFFTSNYGNGFRLRLPIYFILAAGRVAEDRRRKQAETVEPLTLMRQPSRRT